MTPSELKNLTIAVIGGGYGGASVAKALSLTGATVNVYEQAAQTGEVGAGIGLRPSSVARFRDWGIFDAIARVSSPSDRFEILSATGTPILEDTWPEFGDDKQTYLIHRRDFIDALISVLPEGMLHLGYKAERIEDQGDRATVTFTNGETITADLVVAADGIRSVIREQLFSTQQPVFAGEHAYRVVVPSEAAHGLVVDDNLRMYIGRGTKVYFLPLRHRGAVSFDVTTIQSDPARVPEVTKGDLLAALEGFDERIVGIARDLDMAKVNVRAVYDIDPVDVWHSDSVVLLGDAAHAMCHHQGQGANSAILDAGELADSLRLAPTVPEALAAYQANRKPVTDELQRISRQGWDEAAVDDVFPGQKVAAH